MASRRRAPPRRVANRFIGSDAYNLSQLHADLDRFAFLIDDTGAESLFHPGSNGAMPPVLPLDPPC
jgi:hypothetical protein